LPTELAYHTDPFCWEFEAEIIRQIDLPDGRIGVILPKTFFYPTGGGQEHDVGTLGEARVTDVMMDDAGDVIHIVDRAVSGLVHATIDGKRRFAFMQHHSGQHLLSAAVLQAQHIESISANINIDTPSTIDLDTNADLDLTPSEDLANAIIWQDRPIKTYVVDETRLQTIPLRRPPQVSNSIRIVEIEGVDYCACGGTHCTRTGMIGIVKIVKTEHVNKKLRVHFVCGDRALQYFQNIHTIVTHVARQMDTHPDRILDALTKQHQALDAMQKELQELRELKLSIEAKQLVTRAQAFKSFRLITASFRNRLAQELRVLGMQLQNEPGIVAMLASYDGAKVSLVMACAADTQLDANDLLRAILADIHGRGGGDARLAQGGGTASEEWFTTLPAKVEQILASR